jgi:hypothetical protein
MLSSTIGSSPCSDPRRTAITNARSGSTLAGVGRNRPPYERHYSRRVTFPTAPVSPLRSIVWGSCSASRFQSCRHGCGFPASLLLRCARPDRFVLRVCSNARACFSRIESEGMQMTLAWRFLGSMTAVIALVMVLGIVAEFVPVQ